MTSMPESSNPREIRAAATVALDAWAVRDRKEAAELLTFWRRRQEMTDADVTAVLDAMFGRADCPDWCTIDHRDDDVRDDLILHQGSDHTDGTVRKLLDAHQLSVRVARTDDLAAGQAGTPTLTVHLDVELTTWEQAAELARTILDGFGYLAGAEQR
jgi:hypothetical protein